MPPCRWGQLNDTGRCVVLAAGTLVATGSCHSAERLPAGVSNTPVVATVAGSAIHQADLVAQMGRTNQPARGALEELVIFEILARAAAAQASTEPDPSDRELLRGVKVQRLIEREIEPQIAPAAITDAEVRAIYDRGRSRFVHGRLIQVAVLCVFTGARMKPEPRARAEDNARRLKTFVDAQGPGGPAAFEAISKDSAWVDRKVSLATVWQGEDAPFPRVLGDAVKALSKPGDTTGLVGDETGYYIARYIADKPPENVSFAEAAPHIRAEMYEPWRRQRFLQLSLAMAQGHDIEVFPENFPRLASDGVTAE